MILFLKDECDGVGFTVMCNRIKRNYVQTSVYGYAVHVCDVSACLCVRMLYISLYMYVYGVCVYVPVYIVFHLCAVYRCMHLYGACAMCCLSARTCCV